MRRTNIELDEHLVDEGMKLTGAKTRKELVNHALRELVRKGKIRKLLELEGRVEWTGNLTEMRKSRT